MKLSQKLLVHTRLIVIPLGKGAADNFGKIPIPFVILRQQDQVVIAIGIVADLPIKSGAGRHVHLAPDDGLDPHLLTGQIELNDTVHIAMVRDGRRIHSQVFYAFCIGAHFIRAIQQ